MDIIKLFNPILANNPKAEQDFRETCTWYDYQCSSSHKPLSIEYQEYLSHYRQITSLYLTKVDKNNKTMLIVYETESEREEVKILDTPESLNHGASLTQLPNGDLFCMGNSPESGIALTIDRNLGVRVLPPGIRCFYSSCVYFNDNVYCFGGMDRIGITHHLSRKFDLRENRWINLAPMPEEDSPYSCVVFNRNILISGNNNNNLLMYSIETDSFSRIQFRFTGRKRKILINIERLYLIEFNGLIYESEDEYSWKQISNSIIDNVKFSQVYCSYNKGTIYIAKNYYFLEQEYVKFYKFDLSQKVMVELK